MNIEITKVHDYTKPEGLRHMLKVKIGDGCIELPISEGSLFIWNLNESLGIKTQCMHCEKEITINSAITICKECTE